MRLAADGGGVEQQVCAHQRHDARRFGVPLVPAYPDAEGCRRMLPNAKPRIAGAEVIFLFIARPIGDVAFSIAALHRAIRADHRKRIVMMLAVTLKKAGRDGDAQFRRQRAHRDDTRVAAKGARSRKFLFQLELAEIGSLEQLGRQDHVCPLRRGIAHQSGNICDILLFAAAKGELQRGDGDRASHALPLPPVAAPCQRGARIRRQDRRLSKDRRPQARLSLAPADRVAQHPVAPAAEGCCPMREQRQPAAMQRHRRPTDRGWWNRVADGLAGSTAARETAAA